MEAIVRDIRHALKMLLRSPAVTAAALAALALGIGANTAIFSVVYAVLLKPLPVTDVDRLTTVAMDSKKVNVTGAQPGSEVYAHMVRTGHWFESIAAANAGAAAVETEGSERPAWIPWWRYATSDGSYLTPRPAAITRITRPGMDFDPKRIYTNCG